MSSGECWTTGCNEQCADKYESKPYCWATDASEWSGTDTEGNNKCMTQQQWTLLVIRGYVEDVTCSESGTETESTDTADDSDAPSSTEEATEEAVEAPECGEDYYDEDPCGTGLKCDEDPTSGTHQTCIDYDFFEDAEPGDSEFSVITAQNSDNIDEFDLYGDSLDFDWDEDLVDTADEYLSAGSMAIIREQLVDGFGNQVTLYYTEGESDPSIALEDGSESTYEIDYTNAAEAAIIARLGSDIQERETGESDGGSDLLAAVEDGITTSVEDMLLTTAEPQYSFKKVKFEGISYSSLSSYEETETAQATGGSLTTTTGYGGTSGISEDY